MIYIYFVRFFIVTLFYSMSKYNYKNFDKLIYKYLDYININYCLNAVGK